MIMMIVDWLIPEIIRERLLRARIKTISNGLLVILETPSKVYYVMKISIMGIEMKVTYTDKSGKKVEQTFSTEDEGEKLKEMLKAQGVQMQDGNGEPPSLC
jgi:hypothetical protein